MWPPDPKSNPAQSTAKRLGTLISTITSLYTAIFCMRCCTICLHVSAYFWRLFPTHSANPQSHCFGKVTSEVDFQHGSSPATIEPIISSINQTALVAFAKPQNHVSITRNDATAFRKPIIPVRVQQGPDTHRRRFTPTRVLPHFAGGS